MNFIIVFLRLAVVGMILFMLGFLGSREVILYLAAAQVSADTRILTIPQRWREAVAGCAQPLVEGQVFDGFQLRFTDQSSYNMEVRCLSLTPAVRESKSLPLGVKKTTGSAGFYYNYVTQQLSGEITLELWGQKKLVFAADDRANQVWGSTQARLALPASVCQAHGLRCCDAVQEVGVDELHSAGVTDCPTSCYSQCLTRPILLSFQSDPPVDHEQRLVQLSGSSALVLFNFVFDDHQSPIESITLDFGDGEITSLQGVRTGQFSHEYRCSTASCSFTATLRATDSRGVESAQTRLNTITVVMSTTTN